MEALWKNMSERNVNGEPPNWHLDYLMECENAIAKGEDSFITLDAFEEDFRNEMR
jgi:hypothetical protein